MLSFGSFLHDAFFESTARSAERLIPFAWGSGRDDDLVCVPAAERPDAMPPGKPQQTAQALMES